MRLKKRKIVVMTMLERDGFLVKFLENRIEVIWKKKYKTIENNKYFWAM